MLLDVSASLYALVLEGHLLFDDTSEEELHLQVGYRQAGLRSAMDHVLEHKAALCLAGFPRTQCHYHWACFPPT